MVKKIISTFFHTAPTGDLPRVFKELTRIRSAHTHLVLYGAPTGANWLGIANATKGLYPDNSLEIPQSYSICALNNKDQLACIQEISSLGFDSVLISGIAPYFIDWIEALHTKVAVSVLYHGTISEWHDASHQALIGKMIQLGKQGAIKEFQFVKKGLDNVFRTLYNLQAVHQPLANPILPEGLQKLELDRTKIHIGIFGTNTFNKNLHNQVVHALMLPNTVVHVLDNTPFDYLGMQGRIIGHGKHMNREDFLGVLGSMDLNLYLSFNESWGLVAKESEMLGVPVLAQNELDYIKLISDKLGK
jgi:hypothetical protein